VLKRAKQPLHSYLEPVRQLRPKISCPLKVEFEADALSELANTDASAAGEAAKVRDSPSCPRSDHLSQLYDELATELDPIRAAYYRFRKQRIPGVAS
jgi:hypothetical protein